MSMTLTDSDVQFLAARLRRLCNAFDYPAAEGQSDEFVVGVAGSLPIITVQDLAYAGEGAEE